MRRLLVTCTKRRQTEVGAPFGTCSRVWSDGAAERTGAGVAAAAEAAAAEAWGERIMPA